MSRGRLAPLPFDPSDSFTQLLRFSMTFACPGSYIRIAHESVDISSGARASALLEHHSRYLFGPGQDLLLFKLCQSLLCAPALVLLRFLDDAEATLAAGIGAWLAGFGTGEI